jgi:hypothetical protein
VVRGEPGDQIRRRHVRPEELGVQVSEARVRGVVPGQPPLRRPVRAVLPVVRPRPFREPPDQVVHRRGAGCGSEDGYQRRPRRLGRCGDHQAGGQRVVEGRQRVLPGVEHVGGGGGAEGEPEGGQVRGRHGAEGQRRHHAGRAAAAQCPQQIVVRVQHPSVSEHDGGRQQAVAGQAVPAAENAEPAAQGQPGDADRRPAPGGDGATVPGEPVVDLGETHSGADHGPVAVDPYAGHRAHVDHHAGGAGPAGEAVAAAAYRDRVAAVPALPERGTDVGGRGAGQHGRGPDSGETRGHHGPHPRAWETPGPRVSQGCGQSVKAWNSFQLDALLLAHTVVVRGSLSDSAV